jgi:hypothetical protein
MADETKTKRGRPRLPDDLRRRHVNIAAVLPEEFARQVQAEADKRGLSYSRLIRGFIDSGMAALASQ